MDRFGPELRGLLGAEHVEEELHDRAGQSDVHGGKIFADVTNRLHACNARAHVQGCVHNDGFEVYEEIIP